MMVETQDFAALTILADLLEEQGDPMASALREVIRDWGPCMPLPNNGIQTRYGTTRSRSRPVTSTSSAYLAMSEARMEDANA